MFNTRGIEPLISIIIPVYRGAQTIGPLVDKLLAEFKTEPLEIVLVNDGSPDNSDKMCHQIQKQYPSIIRFVDLARNFGEHNAVLAGLTFCKGDAAVIMDDDFQNPPSEIRSLIELIDQGYDVVYGVYDRKFHKLHRNLGSWFNGKMANILLKKPKDLYLSSFKAMNRFLIDQVTQYTHPYPYIDGLIFRVTTRIGKTVVKHSPRIHGESNYNLRRLIRLWLNMFTNFSVIPLRMATLLGGFTIGFGIILAILTVYWAVSDPNAPKGWPTMVCALVIFSGVQLLVLGVIGEYLGRLFLGLNGTPQYVVRRIIDEANPK